MVPGKMVLWKKGPLEKNPPEKKSPEKWPPGKKIPTRKVPGKMVLGKIIPGKMVPRKTPACPFFTVRGILGRALKIFKCVWNCGVGSINLGKNDRRKKCLMETRLKAKWKKIIIRTLIFRRLLTLLWEIVSTLIGFNL